jgi:hypothetical protein
MGAEEAADDELAWRWHDNVIHGLSFERGEPENGDWRSELVLVIDHIVEWLCPAPGEFQFRIAPARLSFHDVSDFFIRVDQGDSGGRNALFEWSIDRVERQRLDRTFNYWRWTVHLNAPPGGTLGFCASGFSLDLTAEPVVVNEQRLPRPARET